MRVGVTVGRLVAIAALAGVAVPLTACGDEDGPAAPAGASATTANAANGGGAPGATQRAIAFVEEVTVPPVTGGLATVRLKGQLPTPCHLLRWKVGRPDAAGRITVDVFSEVEADALCSQVTQPFDQTIDLGPLAPGAYQAVVNGAAFPFTA